MFYRMYSNQTGINDFQRYHTFYLTLWHGCSLKNSVTIDLDDGVSQIWHEAIIKTLPKYHQSERHHIEYFKMQLFWRALPDFCIGCGNSSLKQNIIGQSVYMVLWLGSVFVPGNHWPNAIKHWYMVNTETILHYNAVTTCQASKPRHAGAGNILFGGKNNKFNVKCHINGPPVPSHNLKY